MASVGDTPNTPTLDPNVVMDPDAPGPPMSVPDSGDTGEGGKLKMILQLVKKCLGKDIVAMRLSLPASLLEPIPNLEYWQYLDRPDIFSAINDSDDPFERILAVVRFTFTKDLKFIQGKVCKPYNSVLGEHFRSHWDVIPVTYSSSPYQPPIPSVFTIPSTNTVMPVPEPAPRLSETGSIKSSKSSKSGLSVASKVKRSPSTAATSPELSETTLNGEMSNLNLTEDGNTPFRVVFITEQISHHPPISVYHASCPSRNLELSGIDQISAKVYGTTLRVSSGPLNKGIFVKITGGNGKGEMYNITHPVASVNGILRGSFYVTVGDSTIITCTGGRGKSRLRYRAILEYQEESWLGKPRFLIEGVIHTYTEGETVQEEWTKVKHVPQTHVVAVLDGSWKQRIRWRRVINSPLNDVSNPGSVSLPSLTPKRPSLTTALSSTGSVPTSKDTYYTLLDLSTLEVIPKSVRSLDKQLPHESRKLWHNVTTRLLSKEFGEATKEKVGIEQKQRDEAAERKRKGVEFIPRYFEKDISSGIPALTAEGRKALEEEMRES